MDDGFGVAAIITVGVVDTSILAVIPDKAGAFVVQIC